MWKYIASTLFISSFAYCIMRYFAGGVCYCKSRLDGLVIIITGANSGIGRALSFELAQRGASLILACRDVVKGNEVKKQLLHCVANKNSKIYVMQLDLTSYKSVVQFSETINKEFAEIYALVNNAGVFYHPQQLTVDGFDVTLQTNYLGQFVLTHHLLRILKKSDHARIINVVSEAHRHVNSYDLKAITICQKEFRSHFTAYGVSKLALVLFTKEFSKRLSGTNVIVNAVNPGNVETAIYRYFPPLSNAWLYAIQWPLRVILIKSPHQGAQSILHAVLTSNRTSGQYITDCKLSVPSAIAQNDKLAKEYYNLTLEILAEQFNTDSEC